MISTFRTTATLAGLLLLALAACGGEADVGATPTTTSAATPAAVTPVTPGAAVAPATSASPAQSKSTAGRAPRRVVLHGIDLTGIGYDDGNPNASVVVVNFSDFGCPFCGTFARETYPTLAREFVGTGKVFFKYVPFVMGMFPNGDKAARAAECAADQGKFTAMHDRLYADQAAWRRGSSPAAVFQQAGSAIGLDRPGFDACYADGRTDSRTAAATDRATRLGVRATPSFFVGDRLVEGALPLEQFRALLTEATR